MTGGYYRRGKSGLILLCARCARVRDYWPSELLAPPDRHNDCADCGEVIE